MRGATEIVQARSEGWRPEHVRVWLDESFPANVGPAGFPLQTPEIIIGPSESIATLDLRCLRALSVTLVGARAESADRLDELAARLERIAGFMIVARLWLPLGNRNLITTSNDYPGE